NSFLKESAASRNFSKLSARRTYGKGGIDSGLSAKAWFIAAAFAPPLAADNNTCVTAPLEGCGKVLTVPDGFGSLDVEGMGAALTGASLMLGNSLTPVSGSLRRAMFFA